jgi:hypothetical protein
VLADNCQRTEREDSHEGKTCGALQQTHGFFQTDVLSPWIRNMGSSTHGMQVRLVNFIRETNISHQPAEFRVNGMTMVVAANNIRTGMYGDLDMVVAGLYYHFPLDDDTTIVIHLLIFWA